MANMHLMADSLGLGSCWVQCRLRGAVDGRSTEEYVRDILHFPETHRLEAILALGVIDTHPAPYTPDQLRMDKVHYETF
jgi:nitroreductase